mmetsp:Transcript_26905/g.67759  ORF Transcript_26905/g.67759 Transcript_26905/m.67759 type:complete len:228 (-) Transcript_26905:1648-2331(-)
MRSKPGDRPESSPLIAARNSTRVRRQSSSLVHSSAAPSLISSSFFFFRAQWGVFSTPAAAYAELTFVRKKLVKIFVISPGSRVASSMVGALHTFLFFSAAFTCSRSSTSTFFSSLSSGSAARLRYDLRASIVFFTMIFGKPVDQARRFLSLFTSRQKSFGESWSHFTFSFFFFFLAALSRPPSTLPRRRGSRRHLLLSTSSLGAAFCWEYASARPSRSRPAQARAQN